MQTCIVHQLRSSLRYVNYKDRRVLARDLRPVYTAPNADAAPVELDRFDEQRGARYPMIAQAWRRDWEHIIPFLALPEALRRVVYTTNTIEAMHRQIRKAIKTRGHFPDEQAATKLIYLALERAETKSRSVRPWTSALATLKIHLGDRTPTDTRTHSPRPHTQFVGHPLRSGSTSRAKNSDADFKISFARRSEIAELHGADGQLEAVTLKSGERLPFAFLFLFLGARPCTDWLDDVVARDENGFILTGAAAGADYILETSVQGVFAAGDVRSGSTKRCATAVGEGAMAVQLVHAYLAQRANAQRTAAT